MMMEKLQNLHAWVIAIEGWRRWVLASVLGFFAMLALPPIYAVIFLIPAFTGLVWLIQASTSLRSAFSIGWWFGFGYFVAGLYWIGIALWIKAAQFGWLIPFAVIGLPAILAIFIGFVTMLTKKVSDWIASWGLILVLGSLWVAFEWIRGWVFTGFPWNLIGSVWTFSDSMIQLAAVTGVYGLSFITVCAAAMPAVLTEKAVLKPVATRAVIVCVIGLCLIGAGGALRLITVKTESVPDVRLRLVQPNIPQALKRQRELRAKHVMKQLHMSQAANETAKGENARTKNAPPTHVIWAETAVPFMLANEPTLQKIIGEAVPRRGLIITGAPRASKNKKGPFQVWNSLHAVDERGSVVATYDKAHLVPFGEYVPFRNILGMSKITAGHTDFTAGPGPQTLRLKGLPPVSPLICYEGIFPGRVLDPYDRPQWLLNVTNDAWYGRSVGPYQHFAAVRLRAVEEGLPLARVANTGISAVIDPFGRNTARLGLIEAGVIDSPLPQALTSLTPYARYGDRLVFVLLGVMVIFALVFSRRHQASH